MLGSFTPIRSTAIFGGVTASKQIRALQRRPEVVVACPGRLLDLHQQGEIDLREIEVLVLDEADHMFDMGFLPSIRRILAVLPRRRQNLLFSATMPREIRRLTDDVLYKAHVVELQHSAPAETIDHALYPVSDTRKQDLLEHLLDEPDFTSAIVFLRTKSRAKRLALRLDRRGHRAVALQGNMSQGQRERAMQGFRDGRFDVLVATDIAARGIDVAGVSHVINYDVPNTPDAYTHRIGRTGRSERKGKACTMITREDHAQVRAIEKRLGQRIAQVRLDGFEESGSRGKNTRGGRAKTKDPLDFHPRKPGRRKGRAQGSDSGSGSTRNPNKLSKSGRKRARRFGAGLEEQPAKQGRSGGGGSEERSQRKRNSSQPKSNSRRGASRPKRSRTAGRR